MKKLLFMLLTVALITSVSSAALTEYFEDFEGFTVGSTVGSDADWNAGGVINATGGVAGSQGIDNSGEIFQWVAHAFSWANDLAVDDVIILGMDFQGGSSGAILDDDRLGFMHTANVTTSDYIFGVQCDPTYQIQCYWENGGGNNRNHIADITPVTGTWYRFRATFTKLTNTSCSIDVSLVDLDASGNPIPATEVTGRVDDSSLSLPLYSMDYFENPLQYPAYKNHTAGAANADNAYFAIGAPDSLEPVYPEDGGWVVYNDPTLYLEWHRFDPNGPELPLPYNVDVYLGQTNPLLPTDRIETNEDIDTTTNFGLPLIDGITYYWRVDVYEPNELTGGISVIKGPVWSFDTRVPAELILTETDETPGNLEDPLTVVSEEGPTSDTITLSLSKDPLGDVEVTLTEVPILLNAGSLELESWNGEAAAAPELQVTHSGGTAIASRVNADDGDLEEYVADGEEQGDGSSDLEFFTDSGGEQIIALHFTAVDIPQGATIDSAIVEFEVDVAHASQVYGMVTGEKVINAPAIVDATFHIRDRLAANPTSATTSFAWTDSYAVDTKVQTSDISSIITEIVGQAGWVSGNSIVLFFTEELVYAPGDLQTIATVTLNSGNWTGITVSITAFDDDILETDPEITNVAVTTSSSDTEWDALTVPSIAVNVLENECGAWLFAPYDFNEDCFINIKDLAMFAEEFGTCSDPHFPALCEDAR